MGIFDFIKTGVSNVIQTTKTIAANTLSSIGVNNNFVSANTSSFTSPIPLAAKVAEHPFITAGIVTVAVNPVNAVNLAKTAITKAAPIIKNTFNVLPTSVKTGIVVASPLLITSATARKAVVQAPSQITTFYSDVGKTLDNPTLSNAVSTFKDSPIIAGGLAVASAAVVGGGIGLAANTVATYVNSRATKANTSATLGGGDVMTTMPVDAIDTGLTKLEAKAAKTQQESDYDLQKLIGQQQLDIIDAQTKQAKELASLSQANTAVVPVSETPLTIPTAVKATTKKKVKKKPKKKAKKRKVYKKRKKKK